MSGRKRRFGGVTVDTFDEVSLNSASMKKTRKIGKRGRKPSSRTMPLYTRLNPENTEWFKAKIAREKKNGKKTSMSKWLDDHFDELRKREDRKSA